MGYGRNLGRCDHCNAKTLAGQPHRAQCPTLTIERLRAALAAAEAEVVALRGRLSAAEDEREKYRLSAVQFCAAHIGVPLYSCPVCAEPNIAHQAATTEPVEG